MLSGAVVYRMDSAGAPEATSEFLVRSARWLPSTCPHAGRAFRPKGPSPTRRSMGTWWGPGQPIAKSREARGRPPPPCSRWGPVALAIDVAGAGSGIAKGIADMRRCRRVRHRARELGGSWTPSATARRNSPPSASSKMIMTSALRGQLASRQATVTRRAHERAAIWVPDRAARRGLLSRSSKIPFMTLFVSCRRCDHTIKADQAEACSIGACPLCEECWQKYGYCHRHTEMNCAAMGARPRPPDAALRH